MTDINCLGTWDAQSIFVGPYIAPHTNITEIDAGLDLLWRAGVTPDKVVMGEGCECSGLAFQAQHSALVGLFVVCDGKVANRWSRVRSEFHPQRSFMQQA